MARAKTKADAQAHVWVEESRMQGTRATLRIVGCKVHLSFGQLLASHRRRGTGPGIF